MPMHLPIFPVAHVLVSGHLHGTEVDQPSRRAQAANAADDDHLVVLFGVAVVHQSELYIQKFQHKTTTITDVS